MSLGLLAVLLIAALGALLIFTPGEALLLIGILVQPLFYNTRPPPIAEDQLAGANWYKNDDASRNLSMLLQRRFPAGSSEGTLISTLLGQGFKPLRLAPNQGRCLPQYEARVDPNGHTMRARCDAYDPNKTYQYSWAGGVCGADVTVWWTTDDRGNLVKVLGAYDSVCL
jgi:hypothetical protein